jgi:hypothetical protein
MRLTCLVLWSFFLTVGCAPKPGSHDNGATPTIATKSINAARLAYQHTLLLDAAEEKIAPLFELAQVTCREAAAQACVVLESRIGTGRSALAALKFRAQPEGIRKLIASLSQGTQVTEQSTQAEDLAPSIDDSQKKLAMLVDYRTKLEALSHQAKTDVDALIKVTRELAQVQSDLEALSGKHAQLIQRVETEILSVTIQTSRRRSFWPSVANALEDFGANLSQGLSTAITGVAFIVPWFFVLLVFAWGGRRLWRFWKLR